MGALHGVALNCIIIFILSIDKFQHVQFQIKKNISFTPQFPPKYIDKMSNEHTFSLLSQNAVSANQHDNSITIAENFLKLCRSFDIIMSMTPCATSQKCLNERSRSVKVKF